MRNSKQLFYLIKLMYNKFIIYSYFMIKEGSRAQVYHGTAEETSGGLIRNDLIMVNGRIKSKRLSIMMSNPNKNPLVKLNLLVKKGSGKFGADLTKRSNKRNNKNKRSNKRNNKNKRTNKRFIKNEHNKPSGIFDFLFK